MFAGGEREVGVLVLTQGEMPEQFRDVLAELGELVPLLRVTERPWDEAADTAISERAPAVVLLDEAGEPSGVRFSGYPGGYEFGIFVQDLADAAHGRVELSPDTLSFLADLDQSIAIKVFTTPT